MSWLRDFFDSSSFMPHGHSFLWQPNILWLHVLSDGAIGFAYFLIPLLLFYLIRNRKDLPYKSLFTAFSAFILLCGITHFLAIWVLWHPNYALEGVIKALTALVCLGTVLVLWRAIPRALSLIVPAQTREIESQFQVLANALPQLVWTANSAGWINWYNDGWYRYTGTTPKEMEGWGWQSVHDPKTLPSVMEKWLASIAAGAPFEMVFPLKGADGTFRPFLTRVNPVFDSAGKLIKWFGTNTDITLQYETEAQAVRALREETTERTKLLALIENASDFIGMADLEGNLQYHNHAARLMLGFPSEFDFNGMEIADMHPAWASEYIFETVLPILYDQGFWKGETALLHRDGHEIPVTQTMTLYRDEDGTPRCFTTIMQDISARKTSELALKASEDTLKLALRGTGVGMWDWDVTTNDIYWSDRFKQLLGFAPDEFPGLYSEWEVRLHPDDRERIIPQLEAHLAHRTPYSVDYRLITKSGEWRWYHATGQAVWDENGKPLRMAGSLDDITESKLQAEALRTSEETFRSAMEAASVGMAIARLDGSWLKVNPALCKMVGYTSEEILGLGFKLITHEDDMVASLALLEDLLTGRIQAGSLQKRYYHRNGSIIHVIVSISLISNTDGSPNYYVVQVQDITEQMEIERIKSEFISIVSHELRTPLTSIRGSLGLVIGAMSQDLSEKVKTLLSIAHGNCERLILLINDILDIDKIAAGQMRFDMELLSIVDLTAEAVEANIPFADRLGIKIDFSKPEQTVEANLDAARYGQIITNLLSNALKFSESGATITVAVELFGAGVRVSVMDTGPGIPAEFQPKLFGKFAQADSSVTRSKGGTGLGLHITKQLVERMGGEIGFESTPGVRTVFYIDFPVALTKNIPPVLLPDKSGMTGVLHFRDDRSDPSRILHMEDDLDFSNVLSAALNGRAQIISAATLQEAKALLLNETFKLVVIDIGMPDGPGLSLIEHMDALLDHVPPIVILSADATPPEIQARVAASLIKSRVAESKVVEIIVGLLEQE